MEAVYQEYLGYLEELSSLLAQMTETAEKKADAARDSDLVRLDECMKKEQAYSMTLRSMDQRRDKMLGEMGLSGITLSQLAEHYPLESRTQAARAAEKAMDRYEHYMSASNRARTTMECALRDISRMLPENQPPEALEDPPLRMRTDFRA